jgi:hypothetical protein
MKFICFFSKLLNFIEKNNSNIINNKYKYWQFYGRFTYLKKFVVTYWLLVKNTFYFFLTPENMRHYRITYLILMMIIDILYQSFKKKIMKIIAFKS